MDPFASGDPIKHLNAAERKAYLAELKAIRKHFEEELGILHLTWDSEATKTHHYQLRPDQFPPGPIHRIWCFPVDAAATLQTVITQRLGPIQERARQLAVRYHLPPGHRYNGFASPLIVCDGARAKVTHSPAQNARQVLRELLIKGWRAQLASAETDDERRDHVQHLVEGIAAFEAQTAEAITIVRSKGSEVRITLLDVNEIEIERFHAHTNGVLLCASPLTQVQLPSGRDRKPRSDKKPEAFFKTDNYSFHVPTRLSDGVRNAVAEQERVIRVAAQAAEALAALNEKGVASVDI